MYTETLYFYLINEENKKLLYKLLYEKIDS